MLPERIELHGVQLVFFCGELRFHCPREREIHVVAAQQDVFADGDAFQAKLAVFFGDGDQGEVGGAAADIDDEDQVADLDLLAPVGLAFDPGIKCRLRLFEQDDVLVAGLFRRMLGSARAQRHRTKRAR